MKSIIAYYYKNPFTGVCVLLSAIPFWVPLGAIFFTGADTELMLLTSALVFGAKAYAKAVITRQNPFLSVTSAFVLSPFAFIGRIILFMIVTGFLAAYGSAGAKLDSSLAAIGIILAFNFIFIRPATDFKFLNTLLFFFGILLWIAFLSGMGGEFALLGYAVSLYLFHLRLGVVKWS